MTKSNKPTQPKSKKPSAAEDDFDDLDEVNDIEMEDVVEDDDNSLLDSEPDMDLVKKSDINFSKGFDPFDDDDDDDF